MASRIMDLRGVPLFKHLGTAHREVKRPHSGDLLEIITADSRCLEAALSARGREFYEQAWKESIVCTIVMKKFSDKSGRASILIADRSLVGAVA